MVKEEKEDWDDPPTKTQVERVLKYPFTDTQYKWILKGYMQAKRYAEARAVAERQDGAAIKAERRRRGLEECK